MITLNTSNILWIWALSIASWGRPSIDWFRKCSMTSNSSGIIARFTTPTIRYGFESFSGSTTLRNDWIRLSRKWWSRICRISSSALAPVFPLFTQNKQQRTPGRWSIKLRRRMNTMIFRNRKFPSRPSINSSRSWDSSLLLVSKSSRNA